MTVPSWLSVTGSPVTSSGTLTVSSATVCVNCAVIGPNGVTGALTARALISADIPGLDSAKIITGQLAVARGGTGLAVAANNAVIVGDGTNWNSTTLPSCRMPTLHKLKVSKINYRGQSTAPRTNSDVKISTSSGR